jgi:hypothetical protein
MTKFASKPLKSPDPSTSSKAQAPSMKAFQRLHMTSLTLSLTPNFFNPRQNKDDEAWPNFGHFLRDQIRQHSLRIKTMD